jgi:hypothetical protein
MILKMFSVGLRLRQCGTLQTLPENRLTSITLVLAAVVLPPVRL